jgi:hypothetical protein
MNADVNGVLTKRMDKQYVIGTRCCLMVGLNYNSVNLNRRFWERNCCKTSTGFK